MSKSQIWKIPIRCPVHQARYITNVACLKCILSMQIEYRAVMFYGYAQDSSLSISRSMRKQRDTKGKINWNLIFRTSDATGKETFHITVLPQFHNFFVENSQRIRFMESTHWQQQEASTILHSLVFNQALPPFKKQRWNTCFHLGIKILNHWCSPAGI